MGCKFAKCMGCHFFPGDLYISRMNALRCLTSLQSNLIDRRCELCLSLSIASMVKSFTDYWLVHLLIDKKTLSSYSLIKVSKCLVAAMCWHAVFLLNQSTKITPKLKKFVITFKRSILIKNCQIKNIDKCSEVHTVGLSEVWNHLRRL